MNLLSQKATVQLFIVLWKDFCGSAQISWTVVHYLLLHILLCLFYVLIRIESIIKFVLKFQYVYFKLVPLGMTQNHPILLWLTKYVLFPMWAVIVCQNFENHCIKIINYNFLKIDQIYIEINFKYIPESLLFILLYLFYQT